MCLWVSPRGHVVCGHESETKWRGINSPRDSRAPLLSASANRISPLYISPLRPPAPLLGRSAVQLRSFVPLFLRGLLGCYLGFFVLIIILRQASSAPRNDHSAESLQVRSSKPNDAFVATFGNDENCRLANDEVTSDWFYDDFVP